MFFPCHHKPFNRYTVMLYLSSTLIGLMIFNGQMSCSFNASNSSKPIICHNDDRLALLRFSNSLTLDGGVQSGACTTGIKAKTASWQMNDSDCCQWDGILCNPNTGHVTELDLSCSLLKGTIDSNSTLFQLSHLQLLDLSGNFDLNMPSIETLTVNLTNLVHLDLSFVSINMALPSSFGNLSSLAYLDVSQSGLQGKFPCNILHLPYLQTLYVVSNTGLYVELDQWSSPLLSLYLSNTKILNQLPVSINQSKPLEVLHLYYSQAHGPIPTWVWNVTRFINLAGNSLTGNIAPSVNITTLSGLTDLYLEDNNLSGIIPSWLFQLPSLTSLGLHINQFSGLLSEMVGNASNSLELIVLNDNKISGSIPNYLFDLLHLTALDLSDNNFSGVVELNMFSKFKRIDTLSLSQNKLSVLVNGSQESDSSSWPQLSYLGLSSCNIREFPYLGNQDRLTVLDLSNNNIQGEIPKWFLNISQAGFNGSLNLYLSQNSLVTGLKHLPWKKLGFLDLSTNMIQETLPIIDENIQLLALYASDNRLRGKINPSICGLASLIALDLSNNTLVGEIPSCLGNTSSKLAVLNLGVNGLTGTIPPKFSMCDSLNYLDLSNNQLKGVVSHSLSKCTSLQFLNLGSNKLVDTFPSWLDSLPHLQVLGLHSNGFHGHITSSNLVEHPFPELQIIDISNNNFSGLLPIRYIKSFKAMINASNATVGSPQYLGYFNFHYSYSIKLTLKGLSMEYTKIITTLATFDLSNNAFKGGIPECIGKLVSLRGLNLSHNQLRGPIPSSLGDLSLLESLDLSSNKLTGRIPQELSHLNFLEVFNISENKLVGPIPLGNPFDTFSIDSYKGNLGLYGPPLESSGGSTPPRSNPKGDDNKNDTRDGISGSLLEWQVIIMGYGCGTVVGLAWGYYMFLVGKPLWFIRLATLFEVIVLRFYDNLFERRGRRRERTNFNR